MEASRSGSVVRAAARAAVIACMTMAYGCASDPGGTVAPVQTPTTPTTPTTPSGAITLAVGASTTMTVGTPLSISGGSSGGEYLLVTSGTALTGVVSAATYSATSCS